MEDLPPVGPIDCSPCGTFNPSSSYEPTFEKGRQYLAPGLFGPCGYGLPAILGARIGCPDVPVVGFAGDGAFGISMNEMTACGRNDWPAITMVIFRNYQWGAEKRNTTLWYEDNFVGTELNQELGEPFRRDAMTATPFLTKIKPCLQPVSIPCRRYNRTLPL